jgi:hypothetical protein
MGIWRFGEEARRAMAERDDLRATLRALVDMHSAAAQAAARELGWYDVAAFIARRHPELAPSRQNARDDLDEKRDRSQHDDANREEPMR